MDLISYRGPGTAGGVSSTLGNAWRKQQTTDNYWWFLRDNIIFTLNPGDEMSTSITEVPETMVSGHYRYCNEFLWPVLHDLPDYSRLSNYDRHEYHKFNSIVAESIKREIQNGKRFFIQDYQLAVLPSKLPYDCLPILFWHIPWPKQVRSDHVQPLAEIARGLLSSHVLGFHVREYADNFMQFVETYLPEYVVNNNDMMVEKNMLLSSLPTHQLQTVRHKHSKYSQRLYFEPTINAYSGGTKIVIEPLGIDFNYWSTLPSDTFIDDAKPSMIPANQNLILSVDRADYTKSVLDRLLMIDRFFDCNPEFLNNISFIQVCGRTRLGLEAFDNYWCTCRSICAAVNSRWSMQNWQPIYWIDQSLTAPELANLYRRADVMLVNPVRDGLNLTAKEFVACQKRDDPGVLLLSSGAGVWHEIGDHALPAPPTKPDVMLDSIKQAINMPIYEKQKRVLLMKNQLKKNTFDRWWKQFSELHSYVEYEQNDQAA